MTTQTQELLDCGHVESPHSSITNGYGTTADGKRHCYDCCAEQDRQQMRETGRATLYLAGENVTNWLGSLKIRVMRQTEGRHNIAGVRYDVWFRFEGESWHGTQYGDFTQIVHCKRIK